MYSTTDYNTMSSSMKPLASTFESVDSVYHYLKEPCSVEEVVSSTTTTSSTGGSNPVMDQLQSIKKFKKEKELANVENITHTNSKEMGRLLSSGRVKYGPITVNPRKQPSKTLFTGRRSKYEVLSTDEEEKRRSRRDRNRLAATKCRTKRETVLSDLENQYNREVHSYNQLTQHVQQLSQYKQRLEGLLFHPSEQCLAAQINSTPPPPQQPFVVSANTGYFSSIMETPGAPSLIPPSYQLQLIGHDEENSSLFLEPTSLLINSACHTDGLNPVFNNEQQTITMTSSSLERLINSLQSPPPPPPDNNKNNSSNLFNSTYDSSSCAQRHLNLSEGDFSSLYEHNRYVN